ncbi:SH3 domain-containing protein [Candidatus Microgenomates bacterium]|nr:SH3 domain-containing protein [Candidatus Microgenomates bacterium]
MSISRLLLILILVATAINLGFNLFSFGSIKSIKSDNTAFGEKLEEITKKQDEENSILQEIKKKNRELDKEDVLGTSDSPTAPSPKPQATYITLNDKKWEDASVYEEKSYSSKVIARTKFGETYLYYKKEEGWYFIVSENGEAGWVNARFFKEVEDLP